MLFFLERSLSLILCRLLKAEKTGKQEQSDRSDLEELPSYPTQAIAKLQ